MSVRRSEKTTLDLWVKAGSDGFRNGGCPVCHQIFMILLLKGDKNALEFNVKTTSLAKPHPEFKSAGLHHVPALVHGDEIFDMPDEIIEYIDTVFRGGPLQYFDPDAELAVKDVFSKFCWYIKEVNKDNRSLEQELVKLDTHLSQEETRLKKFLTGNELSHLDCQMLPKLHHIRIAAGYLKKFEFSKSWTGIWRYLRNAYECEVFTKSCPSDQEIILHWTDRPETPNLDRLKHAEISNEAPKFTFTVPT